MIMQGVKEDGLYQIDVHERERIFLAGDVAPKSRAEILSRGHARMGHRNLLQINKYIKNKQIKCDTFPKDVTEQEIKALPLCDSCQRSKFTKRRMRGRVERATPAKGAAMVTDMKGPIRMTGMKNQSYYQGFQDVHSKYLSARCFAHKSDAVKNLTEVIEEPLYRGKLEHYHSDGAPELMSKEIVGLLKPRGTKMTFSAPYKSTDNGMIERSHRTIFEMAHAMLLFACLSVSFWCEAVFHAVYLFNRLPTNTAEGYMPPITAAFGTEVDLTYEHIFGCTCYALIPPQTREKGFVDKANKCLYLGHRENGSPGYTLYHIAANKIIFSSDVAFDETDLFDGSREGQAEPLGLDIDTVSRSPKDFQWMVGMAYRDDNQMFITTRVVAQQGFVVAYRAIVVNNQRGAEEPRPLHVADAERLVLLYTSLNNVYIDLGSTEGLYAVSREDDEGGVEIAGPAVGRPLSGREDPVEPDGVSVGGAPVRATPSVGESSITPVRRIPATDGRDTPTGAATRDGEPSASTRAPPGQHSEKRQRTQRTPLNVGVLGDVERSFHFSEQEHDFEVNLSDPTFTRSDDVLLYDDIFETANPDDWLEAGREEANSIILANDVFESAELPKGVKPLDTKWVFRRKKNPDHSWRYKGRLVVKGFLQRWGVDYFDTFAPTAKWISLRIFLTLCACLGMFTRQLDVKTAFLYADLDEEVYIKLPAGIRDRRNPFGLSEEALSRCRGPYLRLKKSLYGLKQAPRNWFKLLRDFLLGEGFTNLHSEACLFVKYVGPVMILAIVFVDDILVACKDQSLLEAVVRQFAARFNIKDSGEVNLYLSINIKMNRREHKVELDQLDYIMAMWKRFGGVESRSVRSPLQENWRIHPDDEIAGESDSDRQYAMRFPYRELVGSLLFIMICTRGDLSYAVHYLSRFLNNPPKSACLAAKRVLQYLYNTRFRKLVLGGSPRPLLNLFCDTDWAACLVTRKSVECFQLYFGNGCIMWCTKQQSNIAQSTAEAEYCCLTPGVNQVRWVRAILHELGVGYVRATPVYTDNTTAQNFVENPVHHSRMKQLHLKFLNLRELSEWHVIVCAKISTQVNPADLGTKPLGAIETERKSRVFFEGLEHLDYEPVKRLETIPNDASV